MSHLSIDEMDVVIREMSETELTEVMEQLKKEYRQKRVSLGHAITEKEEQKKRDDLLSDNIMFIKCMQELKDRYERQASEAWRKFDHEAEEFINKMLRNLSDRG
jgi:L-lactate utilization protein LutC